MTDDQDAWNIARHLRNLTNLNIRQAKRDFILQELKEHDNDAKKFWKVIRNVVPSNKSSPRQDILLKHDGLKLDRTEVAPYINDYFINVGKVTAEQSNPPSASASAPDSTHSSYCDTSSDGPQPNSPRTKQTDCNDSQDFFKLYEVTEQDVLKVIKEMNVSKSSGLDDISSFIIKEAFQLLVPEVTYMFNLSIKTATFPKLWKKALVIPIPKSGNLTNVKNYRPISLLPLPGKILEKLIHQQLSNYLESESLLTNAQHGFRKKRFTVHSVAQLITYVNKKMDTRMPTLAVYVDFKKAFDCVQHPVLLNKLSQLNIDRSVTDWIGSYLSEREQRVLANNNYSPFQEVTQGVPQGSVLGPLFYIIYANDISKVVKNCERALYADDTVLYVASRDFNTSVVKLQQDINSLSRWCTTNGIKANTEKTKVMVFGSANCLKGLPEFEIKIEDSPLVKVSSYKYLGVTLDEQLNYNLHVTRLIGSVTAKLNQFRRMRSFLNTKAAVLVYKCMLLPVLEYGDIFLTTASVINKKRLQVLQNKGLRCALQLGSETSVDNLHEEANILSLKFRREQHLLNHMFDQAQNQNSLRPEPLSNIRTRSHKKRLLKIKRPYTEKFKKSLAYAGPKKWNSLPAEFHQYPLPKSNFKAMTQLRATSKAKLNYTMFDGVTS